MQRLNFLNQWLLAMVLGISIAAQAAPLMTPEPGSHLRKTLLNTLRQPVMQALGQSLMFKTEWIQVKDGWAFLCARPFQPNGQPVDYMITVYQQQLLEGDFEDRVCALLQQEQEEWKVVVYNIGATDAVYKNWARKHGAPRDLFTVKK